MTIRFQCPNCAARLGTADEQHAVPVDCPQCHTMLLVPDTTAPGATTRDGLRRAEEAAVNFHSRRKVADAEMDMTPMVDVTFLLLIFFMVTAVFSSQKSFQIPTPKEERAATVTTLEDYQDDPEFVVVRIDENSTFYISAPGWDDEREAPSEHEFWEQVLEWFEEGDGKGYHIIRKDTEVVVAGTWDHLLTPDDDDDLEALWDV